MHQADLLAIRVELKIKLEEVQGHLNRTHDAYWAGRVKELERLISVTQEAK